MLPEEFIYHYELPLQQIHVEGFGNQDVMSSISGQPHPPGRKNTILGYSLWLYMASLYAVIGGQEIHHVVNQDFILASCSRFVYAHNPCADLESHPENRRTDSGI
jgi:hypothetical protein